MTGMTECLRFASHVTPQSRPLLGIQRGRPTRTRPVVQAGQSMGFESRHPALHRSSIFPKQFGDLLAAVAAGDQQHPCSRWSYRDSSDRAISCWMASRMTSASVISSFLMTAPPHRGPVISTTQ